MCRPVTSRTYRGRLRSRGPSIPGRHACSPTQPSSQVRGDDRPAILHTAVFVSDLRHFLDLPDDVLAPARRMAEHLSLIVRAATEGDAGPKWISALTCGRRPGRQPCPGHLAVLHIDVPPSIEWQGTSCGDEGVISAGEHSPVDLRRRTTDSAPTTMSGCSSMLRSQPRSAASCSSTHRRTARVPARPSDPPVRCAHQRRSTRRHSVGHLGPVAAAAGSPKWSTAADSPSHRRRRALERSLASNERRYMFDPWSSASTAPRSSGCGLGGITMPCVVVPAQ